MSDSTSLLTQLTAGQAGKEVTVNELMNAVSPAAIFGRRQSSSGLSWDYFGGRLEVDGVSTFIANGTVTLTASTANFIQCTRAGVVTSLTTGYTPGNIPLYYVVAGVSTVTIYSDDRFWVKISDGILALAMSDANTTLTINQSRNDILQFTGSLTAQRNIVLPLSIKQYTVFNNTSGGFGLQFIGATGTGIVVAAGKRAIVYSDGTNVVRVTADV